ncbi:hypothetical protein [Deinococcus hopiensis]|uniref:Uncharacterized protein n=1 Tax=Deinococcus hopiensis KR-140 TaxID=695939 RepID=A0A1W1UWB5_9DEIO|nr:hypothetical protein [Deinococcus hopiensis]SMB85383.1 hypothetical protein SAMN00790413_03381 [Deinococcus hopiensis KR-140]
MPALSPSPLRTAHPALAALYHHLRKSLHAVRHHHTDALTDHCLHHPGSVLAYDLSTRSLSASVQGNLIGIRSREGRADTPAQPSG